MRREARMSRCGIAKRYQMRKSECFDFGPGRDTMSPAARMQFCGSLRPGAAYLCGIPAECARFLLQRDSSIHFAVPNSSASPIFSAFDQAVARGIPAAHDNCMKFRAPGAHAASMQTLFLLCLHRSLATRETLPWSFP